MNVEDLTRENIQNYIIKKLHRGRSLIQPHIYLLEIEGGKYVLKDYAKRNPIIKWLLGRYMIKREYRRYRRLKGIKGIPKLYKLLDDYGFVMQHIEVHRLPHRKDKDTISPVIFDSLKETLDEMHSRGVIHGDIRRKNILLDNEKNPYFIDFVTAFYKGDKKNFLRDWFYKTMVRKDNFSLIKMKNYFSPDSLSEEERKVLDNAPFLFKFFKLLKKKIYQPISQKALRKKYKNYIKNKEVNKNKKG